jgi:hypothetical protein
VSGQSGAHGEIGGVFIAYLPDDEGLRVLPQKMSRGFGEAESDGVVDFRLHDAGNDLFYGVFDGDDVASGGVCAVGVFILRYESRRRRDEWTKRLVKCHGQL